MNCLFLQRDDIGSSVWWSQLTQTGVPDVEPLENGQCRVTFFWRDPQGNEQDSPWQCVWININGVTDHHQKSRPQSLQRIRGTDVWYWQTLLPEHWRGSYSFIPQQEMPSLPEPHQSDSIVPHSPPQLDMMTLRSWWQHIYQHADVLADPLNPGPQWTGGRGHHLSALHMPKAPAQPYWSALDQGLEQQLSPSCTYQQIVWQSEILARTRPVWILTTGEQNPAERPLAILLDGQFWTEEMPARFALDQMTRDGLLPEAVYVFVDSINTGIRSQELPCHALFWQAIQTELLPQVRTQTHWKDEPSHMLSVGQSFGGLASAYAALFWPDRFGNALCQSASFWWPERLHQPDTADAGWIIQQILQQQIPKPQQPLHFYIEAGRRETLIQKVNHRLIPLLEAEGHQVVFREIEGGHDALCWRGGLLDGLQSLLQPLL